MNEEMEVVGGHVGRVDVRKSQRCMRRGTNLTDRDSGVGKATEQLVMKSRSQVGGRSSRGLGSGEQGGEGGKDAGRGVGEWLVHGEE